MNSHMPCCVPTWPAVFIDSALYGTTLIKLDGINSLVVMYTVLQCENGRFSGQHQFYRCSTAR